MEPRALLNMNGNLSKAAAFSRRSFSAEMTQKLKDELVNTPVHGRASGQEAESGSLSLEDEGAVAEPEAEPEPEHEHTSSVESGFSTPTGVFAISTTAANLPPPATPTGFVNYDPSASQTPGGVAADGADGAYGSPTTPYYLTQGAKLIQMTCPPKQTGKGLFEKEEEDGAGGGEDGVGGRARNGRGKGKTGFPVSGRLGDVTDEVVRKRLADARRRTMGWRPTVGSPLGR